MGIGPAMKRGSNLNSSPPSSASSSRSGTVAMPMAASAIPNFKDIQIRHITFAPTT